MSTATYERQEKEAQEAFNLRIEQLCRDPRPPPQSMKHRLATTLTAMLFRTKTFLRFLLPEPQIPLVKHLEGGGFNHITSVTLPASCDSYRNLILRIPREDDSRPEQHAATLRYVRENTSIPVAAIEATDFTRSNAVGKPYVIQRHIPGKDLHIIWEDLNHSQQCEVAKQVGKILRSLLTLDFPRAGIIDIRSEGSSGTAEIPNIVPFQLIDVCGNPVPDLGLGSPIDHVSPSRESTLDFFEQHFARWRKLSLANYLGEVTLEVEIFDTVLEVAREMNDMGLFKPDSFCLCHLDLQPRNIMVDFQSNSSVQITGILDWDDAIVAPKFVNCQPPGWIWGFDKETHTENSMDPFPYELEGANNTPPTPEQQELKRIFDKQAGDEYQRLAYDHSSRLVKGLFRIAREGLNASWFLDAAERIVTEWDALRPVLISASEQESSVPSRGSKCHHSSVLSCRSGNEI